MSKSNVPPIIPVDPIAGVSPQARKVYEYMLYIVKLHYGGDKFKISFDCNDAPIESGIPVEEWKVGAADLLVHGVCEIRLKEGRFGLL